MRRPPARRATDAPDPGHGSRTAAAPPRRMAIASRLRSLSSVFTVTGAEAAAVQRNVGWLVADRLFRLAVGTVLNVWMIRTLGPSRLGLFSFTQSLVGIFAILSQLGLETIVVRDLVRQPEQSRDTLGSALALRLGGALLTLLASVAATAALRPHGGNALALAVVFASIYGFLAFDVIEGWFQSRSRVAPYVVAKSVAFTLASIAKAWALAVRAPLEVLAMTLALEYALAAVGLLAAFRLEPGAPRGWRVRLAVARRLVRDAWPLMLNNVAVLLAIRIDQTMLVLMRGERENGIYAVAPRLTEILYFIPIAAHSAAAPALLRSHARDRTEYERRLKRVFGALTLSAIGIALPVSLLARWITTTLFGPAFAESGPVLALHVWSTPGLFMGVAITNWFIAEQRQIDLFLRSAVGTAANVGLNLWLIPTMGARGAALATLISMTVAYWLANAAFPGTRALFRLQCQSLWPVAARVDAPDRAGS